MIAASITDLKKEIALLDRAVKKQSHPSEELNWRKEALKVVLASELLALKDSKPVKRRKAIALPPPLVVDFNGNLTLLSDSSIVKRYSLTISFHFIFTTDRKGVETSRVVIKVGSIQVASDRYYQEKGRFDVAAGELDLPARFNVTGPRITGDFSLTFPPPLGITAEAGAHAGRFKPKGKRLDPATGEITLAGATTIDDDRSLSGNHVMIVIAGVMKPAP